MKNPAGHDPKLYTQRHRIEINFVRLKDWRRIAKGYDICPKVLLSAISLAAVGFVRQEPIDQECPVAEVLSVV